MQATLDALRFYNDCEWEDSIYLRVTCTVPACGKKLRYTQHKGATLLGSAKDVVRTHLLNVHPGLRPRDRSLLADEAVEGL